MLHKKVFLFCAFFLKKRLANSFRYVIIVLSDEGTTKQTKKIKKKIKKLLTNSTESAIINIEIKKERKTK